MGHSTILFLNTLVVTAILVSLAGAAVHLARRKSGSDKRIDRVSRVLMRISPLCVIAGGFWYIIIPVFH